MPVKRVTVRPVYFKREGDTDFITSVSVASPDALVVISELTYIDDSNMMAYAVVTEDVPDE